MRVRIQMPSSDIGCTISLHMTRLYGWFVVACFVFVFAFKCTMIAVSYIQTSVKLDDWPYDELLFTGPFLGRRCCKDLTTWLQFWRLGLSKHGKVALGLFSGAVTLPALRSWLTIVRHSDTHWVLICIFWKQKQNNNAAITQYWLLVFRENNENWKM